MIGSLMGFLIGGLIIYVALKCCDKDNVLFTPINYEDESGERLFCHYGTGIVYGGGKTEPYSPIPFIGRLFIHLSRWCNARNEINKSWQINKEKGVKI